MADNASTRSNQGYHQLNVTSKLSDSNTYDKIIRIILEYEQPIQFFSTSSTNLNLLTNYFLFPTTRFRFLIYTSNFQLNMHHFGTMEFLSQIHMLSYPLITKVYVKQKS